MQCESSDGAEQNVVIFRESCGSTDIIEGTNLKKACKENLGEVLVKCKRNGDIWVEKKSMLCEGKKDRFRFDKCSPQERATLVSDYELAERRVAKALEDAESLLQTDRITDSKLRKKMKTVRNKLRKIQAAMDSPRVFVCKANKNLCSGSNAHTLPSGKKVKVCDQYFDKSDPAERASILVHEISHYKTQTNDNGTEHGGCSNPHLARASDNFQKQAEYYEHIIECELYVPQ